MPDASKKAIIQSELDSEISVIETNLNSIENMAVQNTESIAALQNQMDELSIFESGSTKNFYLSDYPSDVFTNKGTLSYKLYKIGKLVYAEFERSNGTNNTILGGNTLYSELIRPQSDFGDITVSQIENNITYKITSIYNMSTNKYIYQMSITTTATEVEMSKVKLKNIILL